MEFLVIPAMIEKEKVCVMCRRQCETSKFYNWPFQLNVKGTKTLIMNILYKVNHGDHNS